MFVRALQNFLEKNNLVKSLLISILDKVIYFIGIFFLGSTKPLITSQSRVEISWKNVAIFCNMLLLA
jgi:hypothetical protein